MIVPGNGHQFPGFLQRPETNTQIRRCRLGPGNPPGGHQSNHRQHRNGDGNHGAGSRSFHHHAGHQGTHQDGHKRAHLYQRVTTHQLGFFQGLGQDRVLHRPEKRGLYAGEKQQKEQHLVPAKPETDRGNAHDHHLGEFDPADNRGFLVPVRHLAGDGGEQEKRQDKQHRGEIDHHIRRQAKQAPGAVGHQQQQGILEQVVVEGTGKLGDKEWQEPSLG